MNVRARRATSNILFVSIVLSLFVAFNGSDNNVKFIMIAYAVMAAILMGMLLGIKQLEFALIGGGFVKDSFVGLFVGVGFIFLNKVNNALSLGAPGALLALGALGQFLAIVIIAPVVEEMFFRGFMQPYVYNNFVRRSNIFSVGIVALLFAAYHFAVYGGFLALINAPGIFLGALVFGAVMGLLVVNKPARMDITTLEAPIIAHMLFNFYLFNQVYQLVAI